MHPYKVAKTGASQIDRCAVAATGYVDDFKHTASNFNVNHHEG